VGTVTTVPRQHYSIREIYRIAYDAVRTLRFLRTTRLGRDRRFTERLMLAVTEVNGCELCSHAHARFALRAGISDAEVRALLGGITGGAPDHQLAAIAFAQHYAHTRGQPDARAWQELVDTYGDEALGALAAVRVMMWGNAMGIPLSSLLARFGAEPDPGSTLGYEVGTLVGAAAVTPLAVAHALASMLRRTPVTPAPVVAITSPRAR
jgi:AhpD family alkylhydroperoxidase